MSTSPQPKSLQNVNNREQIILQNVNNREQIILQKPKPQIHVSKPQVQIPIPSKKLNVYIVWQKARIHGLIPRDSTYRNMCPDETSKQKFYKQYVLKIIEIDEGAAAAAKETMNHIDGLDDLTDQPADLKKTVRYNHMQLFRIEYNAKNPHASVAEIRDAWSNLSVQQQQAYMIKANTL
jgi:hypothetical protein